MLSHYNLAVSYWFDTSGGEALFALRLKLAAIGDPAFKGLATLSMVPRVVLDLVSKKSR